MTALLRAELLKVRTTRLLVGSLLAAVVVTVATLAQVILTAGRAGAPSLGTATGALAVLGAGGRAALVALVVGVLIATSEPRHGTLPTTLLVAPRRRRVVAAKVAAAGVVGAVTMVLTTALSAAVGAATGALGTAAGNGAVVRTVLGLALVVPLYAVLGVGWGSLVRNQTVAVASAVLWVLLADSLIASFGLRWLAPWTPGGATAAIAQDPAVQRALAPWGGALLLVAYGVAFAALGARRLQRAELP